MLTKHAGKLLLAVALFSLMGVLFVFGYMLGRSADGSGGESEFALLREVRERIGESAIDQPDQQQLARGAVRGLLSGLDDPYASYMDPAAYQVFGEEMLNGEYSGVGIWLNRDDQMVRIVAVVPEGPAEGAGIVPGDSIITVDGEDVTDLTLDEVAQRILGEEGTDVTLGLVPEEGDPKELTLERTKIDVPSLEYRLEGDVGILELLSFNGGVGEEVRQAVDDLERRGAEGFVLDMRGNPGGSLNESVHVSSVFLDGGTVVSYQERVGEEQVFETSGSQGTDLPLVVLVDQGSASASEIVAAAIQDRGRGTVVGTATYGKGSVQQVFGLSDGSAIKLTVATYFTPSGEPIGQEGVEPDVVVEDREQQLPRALEVLSQLLGETEQTPAA